jgi:peptidoglycan/xylan/chitin deacetylase (PgdA/CDA1 family)
MRSNASCGKRRAILSLDFEDYRRQELRDHLRTPQPPNPREVERQLDLLLELFAACRASATFFAVGRLTSELRPSVWRRIADTQRLGCHGYEHERVSKQGPRAFREDLHAAKVALEDIAGTPVISYRAPYFSSDGCDPWFGEALAAEGFLFDSSRRIGTPPTDFRGTLPVPGTEGAVTEVPLPSIGFGPKRLTVIGGSYFRLMPLGLIRRLLRRVETQGFIPLVYLHPYDIDPSAPPLAYPRGRYWKERAGARVRRYGRRTAGDKLRALARVYEFAPIETVLGAHHPYEAMLSAS